MALTEQEKRMARAYNMGYLLSAHEPRLLDRIIRTSPKNEFVKAMAVGRDHQELHVGIPRKDQNRHFKNGYSNGRILASHEPEMIEKLIGSPGTSKDYKRGLEAALKEHKIKAIQQKLKAEPKTPAAEQRKDANFQKGFNVGYRLSENHGYALGHIERTGEKYGKYVEGIRAGRQQYEHDYTVLQGKEPGARIFPDDPVKSQYEYALSDNKVRDLNNVAESQSQVLSRKDELLDVPPPKWMEKKTEPKDNKANGKGKGRDIDQDR